MSHFARDQDVFETPDVQVEAYNYDDDQKSAAIQKLNVSVKSSYGKFKGKTLDGKDIDFSDSVDRKAQSGFKVQPDEFGGMSSGRGEETVMERYLRLKEEVASLVSDVERIEAAQDSSEKLSQVSPVDLLEDMQCLQKQLQGLQLDRVLGTEMMVSPEHPYQAVLMRDLKAQVESLKSQGAAGESSTGGRAPLYEVYTRTEAAKFAHLSKLGEVEKRLAQLESLVGNEEGTVSSVTGGLDSKEKDLSSAVLNLQAKVALLDPNHIETVAAQLQELLSLLNQVESDTKTRPEDPEKAFKVTEALEMVGRIGGVAPLIPDLVERLHALKALHERASQFAGSVAYIAETQDQLSQQSKDLESLLAQVQVSLQNNMSTLHSEFTELGSRIKSIQT